jgi:hypothetical protein
MYMVVEIRNEKGTSSEILQIRYYIYNEKNGKVFNGLKDQFLLGASESVFKDHQLPGEEFKLYDKCAVEIEYTGVTGKIYHHFSYYTYSIYDMKDKPSEKDCTLRFTFHYLKSDKQGLPDVKFTSIN